MIRWKNLRDRMLRRQIRARGVRDPRVLRAMRKVPRESFLPEEVRAYAYEDRPVAIGAGQTMSQPYMVALMAEALQLRGGERVLEVGAGSGYAAAVLAEIAAEVYAIERIGQLAERAAVTLKELGYTNVHIKQGDGSEGWEQAAPFDAILVSAGSPAVPEALEHQLRIGGRLVIPVGAEAEQELIRLTRTGETEFKAESLAEVRFVPLIGTSGWRQPDEKSDPAAPSRKRPEPAQT
jgi:protein-L-isoaspartate(D-aspartate) O-methyltransferase